ncbi:MAG: hypothetical protein WC455_11435 [Dehalococcoidia bacterium]|jgi:hypothetical protein
MAARVTQAEVRDIVDNDGTTDMTPFITAANALTDRVDTLDTDGILSDALLKEIERHLAAHFYQSLDQGYQSKSTDGASGSFQGQYGMHLERTAYGQNAMTMDFTGTLAAINKGKPKASMLWLGLKQSEQTDYVDRG